MLAATVDIPDAEAGALFDVVRERIRSGQPAATALRDVRVRWLEDNPSSWVRSVLVFDPGMEGITMSRNLRLCVLVVCMSAGCVLTRVGKTPGTEPGTCTERTCATRPVPSPPPLPFRIQALQTEVQRFFDAAYRSGLPMAVFTRTVPVENPMAPGGGSLRAGGTATATLIPEGGTEDEPESTTCDVCPGGQTGTGTGLGGTNGGADPGWLVRVFPDIALRTAKAMEAALKTRDVEFNEVAPAER